MQAPTRLPRRSARGPAATATRSVVPPIRDAVTTRREVATNPLEFSISCCRLRAPGAPSSTSCCRRTRRTAATAVSSAAHRKATTKKAPASSTLPSSSLPPTSVPPASPSRGRGAASKARPTSSPTRARM